ncbi:UNVERIFIED_CONTAM: hypothetical protein PYX00_003267 [Menopon gallinae]|uniref:Endonuclease n=1 Tax=Menopon gallinae TaxID=328185 RepID=A0AAW2HZP4_9NEOP
MKSCLRSILRLTAVSGVACGGYLIGKYENPDSTFRSRAEGLLSRLSLPSVFAATPLTNKGPHKQVTLYTEKDLEDPEFSDTIEKHREKMGEIMKYGYPSMDNVQYYENFVLSYDRRTRVANWVFEHLTKGKSVKKNDKVDRSKCEFYEDVTIHPYFRATNADYKRSGFDRGHLAAAGNHKSNQKTCEQTFVLSNMAPQVGEGFNRSSWNRLEKYVRSLVRKYKDVYVCTGPLYLPRVEKDGKTYVKYQVIGTNTVAVPTHFFKVILVQQHDDSLEMEAYVMPNQPIPDNVSLEKFQVPIQSIERAAGLIFFHKVERNELKKFNGKLLTGK